MSKRTLLLIGLISLSSYLFSQTRAKKKSDDFVAGNITLFEDSLNGEQLGEFPSKWDLVKGLVEVMQMDDQKVIGFVASKPAIRPLMDKENFLPEHFTLEFDVYFHHKGNEGYYINFDNRKMSTRISNAAVKHSGTLNRARKTKAGQGWQQVAISFNKRAYKVFLNGERLVNVPNITKRPTNFSLSALTHNSRSDKYAIIANIRLAEGGMPLYDRLTTEGRFVTNDIQFETNKAGIKASSDKIIQQVADMLQQHPSMNVRIEGHTDSDGTVEHNLQLSKKRAEAVKEALIAKGIAASRLSTQGFGENKPIQSNDTAEGKAQNRRVEFVLLKK